uniref:Uncharacterized protein n=1 Tax=Ananas comosus var. bracteatus TaxID=296719 RepID=A0A6V7QAG3_ANACO|nr:unnamed protein product [Ananas comosus var. bracteatus]
MFPLFLRRPNPANPFALTHETTLLYTGLQHDPPPFLRGWCFLLLGLGLVPGFLSPLSPSAPHPWRRRASWCGASSGRRRSVGAPDLAGDARDPPLQGRGADPPPPPRPRPLRRGRRAHPRPRRGQGLVGLRRAPERRQSPRHLLPEARRRGAHEGGQGHPRALRLRPPRRRSRRCEPKEFVCRGPRCLKSYR